MAERKLTVKIVGDASSLSRALGKSSRDTKVFGEQMRTAGRAAGIALAAVGAGFAVAATKGVRAASDLNEEINKSNVLFGQSAQEVQAWSSTTANSLGLSRRAALQAAGQFGAMFATLKLGDNVSADMSRTLVKLGADLASFSNQDPEDMLLRLRSGLAGEAEPLRRFGILLSEARVAQEAVRLGLVKQGQKLTEQQKVIARYNLILQDSAKAHGDFARTSASFANQMRIVRAQLENVAASFGSFFLPAVSRALQAFNQFIADLSAARTVDAKIDVVVGKLTGLAQQITSRIGEAVAAVDWDAVWERARGIGDGLQERLESIDWGAVGTAIGNGISSAVDQAIPAAKELGRRISDAIGAIDFEEVGKKAGPGLAAAVVSAFVTLLDPAFWLRNWELGLAVALTVFGGSFGRLVGKLGVLAGRLLARLGPIIGRLTAQGLRAAGRFIARALDDITPAIVDFFERLGPLLLRAGGFLVGLIGRAFAAIGRAALRAINEKVITPIREFLSRHGILNFVAKVTGIDAIIHTITQLVSTVAGLFARLGRWIGDRLQEAWDKMKIGAIRAALLIIEPFTHLGRLGGWARDIKDRLQKDLDAMVAGSRKTTKDIETTFGRSKPTLKPQVTDVTTRATAVAQQAAAAIEAVTPVITPTIMDVSAEARISGGVAGDAWVTGFMGTATPALERLLPQAVPQPSDFPDARAGRNLPPPVLPQAPPAAVGPSPSKGATAQQRNAWFDAMIGRELEGVQDLDLSGQLAALNRIADQIRQRISITKDITRKLKLEADLADVIRQIGQTRQQQAAGVIEALTFGLTKAEATAGLADDLAALEAINAALRRQIREQGATLELQQQLFANEQQIANVRQQQRDARQFQRLGLGPTGEALVPGVGALKRSLGRIGRAVRGTFLDTAAWRNQAKQIGRILSGEFGAVSENVRKAIAAIFAEWDQKMKEHEGPKTRWGQPDISKLISTIPGLTGAQKRALEAQLASVGPTGRAPVQRSIGQPIPKDMIIHQTIELDGQPIAKNTTKHQQRTGRRRVAGRRGQRPGTSTGLA